eukprot:PITA_11174
MVEEYDSIIKKIVWEMVPRPTDKSLVSSIWLYKVKKTSNGSMEKHKAKFAARGFSEVEGIVYEETFAQVARYCSIRSILSFLAHIGWKIHKMDLKTTFLNRVIEEEVYIEHPKGFVTFNRESHVCRLKQALYGLKQAPHAWYTNIDSYFTRLGFTKSEADANLYHIVVEGQVCQRDTEEVPHGEKQTHGDSFKRELEEGICYFRQTEGMKLHGFTNADWAGIPSKKKSTSEGIFNTGSTTISWYIRKHRSVALSSVET